MNDKANTLALTLPAYYQLWPHITSTRVTGRGESVTSRLCACEESRVARATPSASTLAFDRGRDVCTIAKTTYLLAVVYTYIHYRFFIRYSGLDYEIETYWVIADYYVMCILSFTSCNFCWERFSFRCIVLYSVCVIHIFIISVKVDPFMSSYFNIPDINVNRFLEQGL